MVRRLISVDEDMKIPSSVKVSEDNLPAAYIKTINGVQPDMSGNVQLLDKPDSSPLFSVLILNPNDPNPTAAGKPSGTLIVRLIEEDGGATNGTNVVVLNPLDPKPDSSTLTEGTLVLRLLPEEG